MKKSTKSLTILSSCIIILAVFLCFCTPKPETEPKFTNSKVIVTHLGEVDHNIKYIGETIKYKIYYLNTTKEKANIIITDKLDPNLTNITVHNEGYWSCPY